MKPVEMGEANALVKELKLVGFNQCSAKKNENVQKVFQDAVDHGLKKSKGGCILS